MTTARSSLPVPTDDACTSFFCTCYWYYIIGVGGAAVIAIATTCVALVCKMLFCRRKVSYVNGEVGTGLCWECA